MDIALDGYDDLSDDDEEIAAGTVVTLPQWTSAMRAKARSDFEALCSSIRDNKPDMTEVNLTSFTYRTVPFDVSGALGHALQENNHVRSIRLDFPILVAHKRVHFALQDYIRTSTALEKVCLCRSLAFVGSVAFPGSVVVADPSRVAQALFEALACSSSIHELDLSTNVSSKALAWLLSSNAQSLKSLKMQLMMFGGQAGVDRVARAFGANRSLEQLSFGMLSVSSTVESVLLALRSHPCLRSLKLKSGGDADHGEMAAIPSLLMSSVPLIDLLLEDYGFDEDEMTSLVDGLRSKHSLESLSLICCGCSEEATPIFIEYFRTIKGPNALRKLDIFDIAGTIHQELPNFAESILAAPVSTPTIGSSLQQVCLGGVGANSLWDYLNENAETSQLNDVECTYSDDEEIAVANCESMIQGLPKLVRLRKLTIRAYPWDASTRSSFMKAVRGNGSLYSVSLFANPHTSTPTIFTASDLNKVKAYGQRNKHTPHLLALAGTEEDRSHLQSFPPLFSSASAAPRAAPGNFLIGLLTLDDCMTV